MKVYEHTWWNGVTYNTFPYCGKCHRARKKMYKQSTRAVGIVIRESDGAELCHGCKVEIPMEEQITK